LPTTKRHTAGMTPPWPHVSPVLVSPVRRLLEVYIKGDSLQGPTALYLRYHLEAV
jgi:hypothetical protein